MEGKYAFQDNYVGRVNGGGLFEACVLFKGVDRDFSNLAIPQSVTRHGASSLVTVPVLYVLEPIDQNCT